MHIHRNGIALSYIQQTLFLESMIFQKSDIYSWTNLQFHDKVNH